MTISPTLSDAPDHVEPDRGGDPHPSPGEPWFARLARFSATHRRTVMLVWLLATLAAAPLAVTLTGALSGAGWEAQGSTSLEVRDEIRRDFPQLGAEAAVVVYHQDAIRSPTTPPRLQAVVADLQGAPGAASVVDPLAQPAEAGLISPDGRTALIPVGLAASERRRAARVRRRARSSTSTGSSRARRAPRVEVTGEWPVWSDFNKTNEEALHKAELLSGHPHDHPAARRLRVRRSPPGSR